MKALYPDLLMLDGGDVGLSSRPQHAWKTPVLWDAMIALGYEVINLGLRDFSDTTMTYLKQRHEKNPHFLTGNIRGRKAAGESSVLIEKDGTRIGIISAMSPNFSRGRVGMNIAPLPAYLKHELTKIEARKPDFKVLLFYGNDFEARSIAEVYKEFDVIFLGRSNGRPMKSEFRENAVPLVGPGDRSRELALVTLEKADGQQAKADCQIIPLDDLVPSSPKADKYMQLFKKLAAEKAAQARRPARSRQP